MRLFEVDSSIDVGGAKLALSNYRDMANKSNKPMELSFPEVLNILKPFKLPLGGMSSDRDKIMIALKNMIDVPGDVFDVKGDGKGTVILNTGVKDPNQQPAANKPVGPSVEKMAKSNTDLTPNI